jgi:hypothetical protein
MPERTPFPQDPICDVDDIPTDMSGIQQYFPLDHDGTGKYLVQGPYHTDLLQEIIGLASRLVCLQTETPEYSEDIRLATVLVSSRNDFLEVQRGQPHYLSEVIISLAVSSSLGARAIQLNSS